MANFNIPDEQIERLDDLAKNGLSIRISRSHLAKMVFDAFLRNPALFLPQFTINSEYERSKVEQPADLQPAQ